MKKLITFILAFAIVIYQTACGHYIDYDTKPDDNLSLAVKDIFGDAFYYCGKEESDIYGDYYTFQINEKNPDLIRNFVDVLNEQVAESNDKVTVVVCIKQVEVLGEVFSLSNFSDTGLDYADYDGFYDLWIGYLMYDHDSFWDDVNIYSSLVEVKKLEISDLLQEKAEESGIDWYKMWPGLEEVTVYDTSEWGNG
ncbi:MAG: hypothetical protein J6I66_11645 [Lachnospiraceae bacterium]|nr:hypothetical protein [Lachnospiraceae bacterium]